MNWPRTGISRHFEMPQLLLELLEYFKASLDKIYCWGEQCSPQTPLLLPDGKSWQFITHFFSKFPQLLSLFWVLRKKSGTGVTPADPP
jgi:hypothetical protein